jgi:Flp pilus assembly protein TadB
VTTAVLVGVLAAAIAARALKRFRPSTRGAHRHTIRPRRPPAPDYAVLLEAIARQVRSGSSLTGAFLAEISTSSPLGEVAGRISAGVSMADALHDLVPTDADLAFVVQALRATAHLGGPIAATLDEAAAVLRERSAARAERRAHGSQARLSARVLTVVPLVFAAWSTIASYQTRAVYVSTAAGAACAVCGLMLNVLGWRWMNRILGPT